jgi:hypothetical protein
MGSTISKISAYSDVPGDLKLRASIMHGSGAGEVDLTTVAWRGAAPPAPQPIRQIRTPERRNGNRDGGAQAGENTPQGQQAGAGHAGGRTSGAAAGGNAGNDAPAGAGPGENAAAVQTAHAAAPAYAAASCVQSVQEAEQHEAAAAAAATSGAAAPTHGAPCAGAAAATPPSRSGDKRRLKAPAEPAHKRRHADDAGAAGPSNPPTSDGHMEAPSNLDDDGDDEDFQIVQTHGPQPLRSCKQPAAIVSAPGAQPASAIPPRPEVAYLQEYLDFAEQATVKWTGEELEEALRKRSDRTLRSQRCASFVRVHVCGRHLHLPIANV